MSNAVLVVVDGVGGGGGGRRLAGSRGFRAVSSSLVIELQ